MKTILLTVPALLALTIGTLRAQDARSVLQAVAKNIGADNLTTLQFSGSTGWHSAPGASYRPMDDWPRFEVTSYMKAIDFNAHFSHEQIVRQWGPYPKLGGGQGVPVKGQQKMDLWLNGNLQWADGGGPGPFEREGYMDGVSNLELRQLDLVMLPHGFIKAALAPGANPTAVKSRPKGRAVTYITITALGKYRVTATVNERNEIEFIQTHIANPVFGDMLYETRYGPYKQYGALKFPSVLHHHEGDTRLSPAHNVLEVQVSSAQANAPVQIVAPPESAKTPFEPLTRVESQKIADGVWYVGGIRHGSVAVEFRDFVAVIEAPLNETRSIAVIDEVYRLAQNKPIRYLVNTHHHFDHSGGMRAYVVEGAAIVTHHLNREFFEKVMFSPAPRTLEPDRLSVLNPDQVRTPVFELVNQKYSISDGTRTLDLYVVPPFDHAATMLIAYLPRERIVVNADMYTPPKKGAQLPRPNESIRMLMQTIQGFGLDVAQHVGLHGGIGPHEDLVKIVGQGGTN